MKKRQIGMRQFYGFSGGLQKQAPIEPGQVQERNPG
jgi:hypothetical protein